MQVIVWSALSLLASGGWWQVSLRLHELPTELDHWLARWHGLSAMAGLFALGLVAARHIPYGLSVRERRFSGLALIALFAIAALSGYGLAYLVSETWHSAFGISHTTFGILAFVCGVAHRR